MRHPAENWIKYLLSGSRHTNEQVLGILDMLGLGSIPLEYLTQLEDEVLDDRPTPFRPRTKSHTTSQSYLRRQGIYKAWHRDAAMHQALDILSDPVARPLVETFLLSPVPAPQAVAKVNDQLSGPQISEKAYDRFRHYFWNINLLNSAEWGEFVQSRDDAHREWMRLAVNAHGPEGMQLVLWKMGLGVLDNLDRIKIFTDFRNIAYMKAKEMEFAPAGVDDSKALLNYARVARSSQEEVNNSSDAARDVLDSFNAFRMRRSKLDAPSMKQLTEGNFTTAEDVAAAEDKIEY